LCVVTDPACQSNGQPYSTLDIPLATLYLVTHRGLMR
jgi:hypothetical protein